MLLSALLSLILSRAAFAVHPPGLPRTNAAVKRRSHRGRLRAPAAPSHAPSPVLSPCWAANQPLVALSEARNLVVVPCSISRLSVANRRQILRILAAASAQAPSEVMQ